VTLAAALAERELPNEIRGTRAAERSVESHLDHANEQDEPDEPIASSRAPAQDLIDRASPSFIAIIFALTTAMSVQAVS
jgi:hypothetical protein